MAAFRLEREFCCDYKVFDNSFESNSRGRLGMSEQSTSWLQILQTHGGGRFCSNCTHWVS